MTTKGTSKLKTLQEAFGDLPDDFKHEVLQMETANDVPEGFYLLNLLRFTHSDLPVKLVDKLLEYYDCEDNIFNFNGHRIGVTLEDVLFCTGLPISGEAVIKPVTHSRDLGAFHRIFGGARTKDKKSLSMAVLKEIMKEGVNDGLWKKAALLLIISSFIAPNASSQNVDTTFCYFVEDIEKVNDYAWGAALLSYLYLGIKHSKVGIKWKTPQLLKPKKSVLGNTWLLVCFVLIRIPKLRDVLDVVLNMSDIKVPLMRSVVEKVHKLGSQHRTDCTNSVGNILDNLNEQDIEWSPYKARMLSGPYNSLQNQIKYGTLVAPLFCNNFVVHHTPHLVAKQFPVLAECHTADILYDKYEINLVQNSGNKPQNLKDHYNKELKMWKKKYLAQNRVVVVQSDPEDDEHNQDEDDVDMFEPLEVVVPCQGMSLVTS